MNNSPDEPPVGISDEELPEDLQPSEDNPLAEGLDDGETVDDLLADGKPADQASEDSEDSKDSKDSKHDENDEDSSPDE